jgi:hypothetical protein
MKLDTNTLIILGLAAFAAWQFWPKVSGLVLPVVKQLGGAFKTVESDPAKDDKALLEAWWELYAHCRAANCAEGQKALNDLLPHLHSHATPVAPEAK